MIAQAQSGTGKTATFAISILQQIDVELKGTQALVLAPTRELAQQVGFLFNTKHAQKQIKTHLNTVLKHCAQCCSRLAFQGN